ncbi:MAG: hypothetical protein HDT42_11655 [Ruminococcaceae bacterium]|nr:hypothetical protein [Oscillospiraceae bacterium]
MRNLLNRIREPMKSSVWKTALFCVIFLIIGGISGAVSKLADVYSEILGNYTSGICMWILIGTVICVFAKSPFRAAAYVFLLCAGMIAAYYVTAEIGDLYYSTSFVKGWSIFTLFTPIFALIAWYSRGRKWQSWVIRIGIAVVMLGGLLLISGNVFLDALSIVGAIVVTMIKPEPRED